MRAPSVHHVRCDTHVSSIGAIAACIAFHRVSVHRGTHSSRPTLQRSDIISSRAAVHLTSSHGNCCCRVGIFSLNYIAVHKSSWVYPHVRSCDDGMSSVDATSGIWHHCHAHTKRLPQSGASLVKRWALYDAWSYIEPSARHWAPWPALTVPSSGGFDVVVLIAPMATTAGQVPIPLMGWTHSASCTSHSFSSLRNIHIVHLCGDPRTSCPHAHPRLDAHGRSTNSLVELVGSA